MKGKRKKDSKAVHYKKVTSIVKKLTRNSIWGKLAIYLKMDLFMMIAWILGWIVQQEYSAFGRWMPMYIRKIQFGNRLEEISYLVLDGEHREILHLYVGKTLVIMGCFFAVLLLLQLLQVLGSVKTEKKKLRKILAPIDEIALQAEKLGKMTFSEDKYQRIEDVISELEPDSRVSFGDEELMGIEVAINNLLLRMRQSYQQQARFVNDASHELRTPIAVIEGYVNMLARWGKEDEKVLEESIAALQRESGHMKRLVEQLLFLARGDSGKTKLEKNNMSLNDCMQEIYEESLLIDEEHVYRFQSEGDLFVEADFMMLKQAVRILVDNAAKYTEKSEEILLSVGKNKEGNPYLQVQDCGIGMEEKDVEHMFERFYQADDARKYKGTGLGLSIAKWIIDKHGGHFEILSRTQLGTRVRIVLNG